MTNDEISVFICEDPQLAREILEKHFDTDRITYAALFPSKSREAIVNSLDSIQEQV